MQSKVMRGNRTSFRHFFQKAALYSTRVLGFPVGEAVGFCRLKRSLHAFPLSLRQAFPLPEKNSVNFIFLRQKLSATSWLPLGGKVDKAKLWTNEGRPNNNQAFFSKSRLILNPHSRLPPWGSCRLLPTEEVFVCLPPFLPSRLPLA